MGRARGFGGWGGTLDVRWEDLLTLQCCRPLALIYVYHEGGQGRVKE